MFLGLFFIDVAFGGIKGREMQSLRSVNYVKSLKNIRDSSTTISKRIKLVVGIIENRFVATGVISDIKRTSEGPQRFVMHITKIESIDDFANFGEEYLNKSVEILSEIGIPSSFKPEVEVSLVLRVSGDEWGQTLFLLEVLSNETTKSI